MGEFALHSSTFPTARCDTCGKNVLTYLLLANEAEVQRACVHCDTPVGSNLRWVSADELAADGYQVGTSPARPRGSCGGCKCSARGH
ncbi:MAG: hypothetical protein JOZ29_18895 [Deltaproteobacteria bacterium]|nr:hypothetical protein [Deltaproteobacteria bacterium]